MYKRSPFSGRTVEELIRYVMQELDSIEQSLIEPQFDLIRMHIRRSAPPKPENGMIAVTDGKAWNPGSGAGPYYYNVNEWLPLITQTAAIRPVMTRLRLVSFPPKFTNTSQIVRIPKATLTLTTFAPR